MIKIFPAIVKGGKEFFDPKIISYIEIFRIRK